MILSFFQRKRIWLALLILLFCEVFFFRNILGNDLMFGDRGDGRLTMLFSEHWWNFFCGRERFGELAMLYPAKNVIGYSDMFLGFGLIHSFLRLLSFDMYAAFKWTLIIVHIIGTYAMFYLCFKKLHISILWSLFATITFCFSNAFSIHVGHTQLFGMSILPILSIFLVNAVTKYRKQQNCQSSLLAFLAVFVLLMYTSWYVAYFSGLFLGVLLLVYLIQLRNVLHNWYFLQQFIKSVWPVVIKCSIFTFILLIPFLSIYLPIFLESGGYSYADVSIYLPEIADFINVDEDNFMFGNIIKKMGLSERGYSGEVVIGFSVVLSVLFLVTFIIYGKKNKYSLPNVKYKNADIYQKVFINAVFWSIIICLLLIVRLSANGASLWGIIYHILPGSSSVRAIARFVFWLSFPMAIISTYVADKYFVFSKNICFSVGLIVLAWVANVHKHGVNAVWHSVEEKQFINQVSAPPQDAEAFFVIPPVFDVDNTTLLSLDAFEIADFYHIKTINGYSGGYPKDWMLSNYSTYNMGVRQWIFSNNIKNVYAFHLEKNEWIPYKKYIESKTIYILNDEINFGLSGNAEKYIINGFYSAEQSLMWTNGKTAVLSMSFVAAPQADLRLDMEAFPFVAADILQQTVKVYANNQLIAIWQMKQRDIYSAVIPAEVVNSKHLTLRFEISHPASPKKLGISEDSRQLGIAFEKLTISPLSEKEK